MQGETVELNKGKFYREHVSQSIPAIMRGDCNDWDLKKEMDLAIANDTQDLYFINRFAASGAVK